MQRLENTAHTQLILVEPENTLLLKTYNTRTKNNRTIFTIGHSNKSAEIFTERLKAYEIDRVIDVRTKPHSRWCPWFNRNQLEFSLAEADINYDWRGSSLGGLTENIGYDEAIQWVYNRAEHENIVLMCSEADFRRCHRYTMLTPSLEALGAELVHVAYKR